MRKIILRVVEENGNVSFNEPLTGKAWDFPEIVEAVRQGMSIEIMPSKGGK